MGFLLQLWNNFKSAAASWAQDPASWTQLGLIVTSFLAALYASKFVSKILLAVLKPKDSTEGFFAEIRRFFLQFLPLVFPIMAYLLLALGEGITRTIFDSGAVIAFGKRVIFAITAYIFVRDIISAPLLKFLGKFIILPMMALFVVGLDEAFFAFMREAELNIGNIGFNLFQVFNGLVFGIVLFWLGRWSNETSADLIGRQDELDMPTKQLATKAAEFAIYATLFLLLMSIMGIPLSGLAVLSGAIGVGVGFGLQKIAANFVSGVILLLEGQATVGDYVELDGGEAGTIFKMTSRATILETYDGKWIVVPNEDFITTRITNWSDSGSGNRYEAEFTVSYDADINLVPDLIAKAVAEHPAVLTEPEKPDVELRAFGESGVDFAVEFWCEGIDDGKNKYVSDVLFIIWNTLKANKIEIPYPHRVIEMKGQISPQPQN